MNAHLEPWLYVKCSLQFLHSFSAKYSLDKKEDFSDEPYDADVFCLELLIDSNSSSIFSRLLLQSKSKFLIVQDDLNELQNFLLFLSSFKILILFDSSSFYFQIYNNTLFKS